MMKPHFAPKTIGDFRAEFTAKGGPAFARDLFARAKALAGFNAFINLDEAAFTAAYAGEPKPGPLSAIPFAVKDNIDAAALRHDGRVSAAAQILSENGCAAGGAAQGCRRLRRRQDQSA